MRIFYILDVFKGGFAVHECHRIIYLAEPRSIGYIKVIQRYCVLQISVLRLQPEPIPIVIIVIIVILFVVFHISVNACCI